jgi:uncharacterized protein YktA (UPF0223 family)
MFNEEELTFYLAMMRKLYLEEAHEIVSKYDLLKIIIQEEIANREKQLNANEFNQSANFNLYDNLKDANRSNQNETDNKFNIYDNIDSSTAFKDNYTEKSGDQYNHYSNIKDLKNDLRTVTTAKI